MTDYDQLVARWKISGLVLFFLLSCEGQPKEVPNRIVPVDSMALILRDLYWAHGISSSVPGLDSTARDSLYRDRYQQVLARRGMSHDSLQEQLNYYLDHPQFLKAAQDQVVALLKEEQTQAEAQKSKAEASGSENDP